jgi:hypothetical protein
MPCTPEIGLEKETLCSPIGVRKTADEWQISGPEPCHSPALSRQPRIELRGHEICASRAAQAPDKARGDDSLHVRSTTLTV